MMKSTLLGLIAETSLHAGAGKAVGVIDLPIMREAHTGWPCIYGSAVKGALRSRAEQVKEPLCLDIFGPDTKAASDHAGALAVGDARLLLLPIRSLTTYFKWVTCPALLRRAIHDAKRVGVPSIQLPDFEIAEDNALTVDYEGSLFLEEFHFTSHRLAALDNVIEWLAQFVGGTFEQQLKKQLVVVSDDILTHLANYATAITPHIAIDNERKTVKDGALWYEETLPPETVLYVTLAAQNSRKNTQLDAQQVLDATLSLFPPERPYLRLGGNETVGMGWCRVMQVKGA